MTQIFVLFSFFYVKRLEEFKLELLQGHGKK